MYDIYLVIRDILRQYVPLLVPIVPLKPRNFCESGRPEIPEISASVTCYNTKSANSDVRLCNHCYNTDMDKVRPFNFILRKTHIVDQI